MVVALLFCTWPCQRRRTSLRVSPLYGLLPLAVTLSDLFYVPSVGCSLPILSYSPPFTWLETEVDICTSSTVAYGWMLPREVEMVSE